MIYTKQVIKIFEDFSIFMVFEFLNTLQNRTSKVKSIKTSTKHNLKKKHLKIIPNEHNMLIKKANKVVCALQKINYSKIKR